MCYSTCASGWTALSVCSRLCLVADCCCSMCVCECVSMCVSICVCTVLYDAFYSYLCRRYWNGILGPSILRVGLTSSPGSVLMTDRISPSGLGSIVWPVLGACSCSGSSAPIIYSISSLVVVAMPT